MPKKNSRAIINTATLALIGILIAATSNSLAKPCESMATPEIRESLSKTFDGALATYKRCCSRSCAFLTAAEVATLIAPIQSIGGRFSSSPQPGVRKISVGGVIVDSVSLAAAAYGLYIKHSCELRDRKSAESAVDSLKKAIDDLGRPDLIAMCKSANNASFVDVAKFLILGGYRVLVKMNKCDPDGNYSKMGTIACGGQYTGRYNQNTGKWTFSGYSNGKQMDDKAEYRCGSATQLCIWGRGYDYDEHLNVIDQDYKTVGEMSF